MLRNMFRKTYTKIDTKYRPVSQEGEEPSIPEDMFCTPGPLKKGEKSLLFSWAAKAEMEQGVSVIVRESRVEMMPACSRFMKDTPFVDSRGHSRTRAAALCCLLT